MVSRSIVFGYLDVVPRLPEALLEDEEDEDDEGLVVLVEVDGDESLVRARFGAGSAVAVGLLPGERPPVPVGAGEEVEEEPDEGSNGRFLLGSDDDEEEDGGGDSEGCCGDCWWLETGRVGVMALNGHVGGKTFLVVADDAPEEEVADADADEDEEGDAGALVVAPVASGELPAGREKPAEGCCGERKAIGSGLVGASGPATDRVAATVKGVLAAVGAGDSWSC